MSFNSVSFGDSVQMISGKTPSKQNPEFWNGDIPWISASSMDKLYVSSSGEKITEKALNQSGIKYIDEGTPLLLVRGSILHQRIPISIPTRKVTINQDVKALKLKNDNLDPDYFVAWLMASEKSLLEKVEFTGIGAGKLDTEVLNKLSIPCPNKEQQVFIGQLAKSINQKIELNNQINETLESMAKSIFKEWFINFGPVKAKADGKKPFGMDDETASLFPDSFEESELGQVPKGWNISSLYDLADWQNGMAFKASHFSDSGLPIVKIVELKSGIDVSTKRTDQKHEEKFKIRDGEILFSWSGSPETSIDAFIWDKGDAWLNQHIFKVTSKEYGKEFTYSLLKHLKPVFIEIARNKQTTGLGHVTVADLKRLQSVVPKIELINAFNIFVGPILNKIFVNLKENQFLVKTRDLILPKLISGEISLNDV